MHWRDGGHAQGTEDWRALLDFADLHFHGKTGTSDFSVRAYPDAKLPRSPLRSVEGLEGL